MNKQMIFSAVVIAVLAQPGAAALSPGARTGKTGNEYYDRAVKAYLTGERQKIVGGKEVTDPTAYPWQVSLEAAWIPDHGAGHFCGGTIYNAQWIVTAAHCARALKREDIMVAAGTHVLGAHLAQIGIAKIIVHPNYNDATHDNDVALLQLKTPLQFSATIGLLPLISTAEDAALSPAGTALTVTGWGATSEGGEPVRTLRYIDLALIDHATCNQPLSYNNAITANMICAGVVGGGRDACQGDSGGPLTAGAAGSVRLAGIVSWGEGCGRPLKYGVYTRVSQFAGWISHNAK